MPFLFPAFGGVLILTLLGLAALAFTIWMLVDAARRPESDFEPPQARVWWIVGLAVGIFLNLLGLAVAIVYYLTVRKPIGEGRPPAPLFGGGSGAPRLGGGGGGGRVGGGGAGARPGRMCKNCGEPLGTYARYCQNCGTPADLEG